MADITIEAAAHTTLFYEAVRVGPVWIGEDTAYVFYIDSNADLVYRKTVNGGANWDAAVSIKVGVIECLSIWFDKWTPGDGGTKIHIAYMDTGSHDVLYRSLDTGTDTLSAEVIIFNGVSAELGGWNVNIADITKSRGGNLYCGFWIDNDGENGFYRSVDGGATWTARTALADGTEVDLILLVPGAEADTNDIWCFYWDVNAWAISLKVYDDSGNSWAETAIGGSMVASTSYYQMSAATRTSDNHVILAAWNAVNTATADLMVWDIGGAGSIVAKTNVLTNTPEAALCAVFINQQNDDIYVAYLKGTDWTTLVGAYYKKSVDGGVNWGAETALSADAEDNLGAIWAGHSVGDDGGYFMPVWFNDDLNDLITNVANAVAIAAEGGVNATVTAVTATATAEAPVPTITAIQNATISAVVAEASAAALLASVVIGGNVEIAAVVAEASATGLLPTITVTKTVTITAVIATATAETLVPSVHTGVTTLAVVAEASADAKLPTITAIRNVTVVAIIAQATAAGLAPTVSTGIVYAKFGEIIASINPADYPTGITLKLLVVIWTSDAAKPVYARLYNVTDSAVASGSDVNSASTSPVEIISSALSLPSGAKTYRIEVGGLLGGTYYCAKAVVRGTT